MNTSVPVVAALHTIRQHKTTPRAPAGHQGQESRPLTQTEITSLPHTPEFGSGRHAYLRPVNVFVYELNVIGGGVQPKVPDVHGLPVVVRLSTWLQLSS